MDAPNRPEWLLEVQRAVDRIPPSATTPAPLLFDAEHRPIATAQAWQARRETLLRQWRAFLGSIEGPHASNKLEVLEEDRRENVIRQLVRYESETDLPVEGYLLRPLGPGRDRPGVVVLHSTVDYTIRQPAGLEGPSDKHVGLHLARRGYVAFCPRCFLWQYADPKRLAAAVDWLHRRHAGVTGMAKMLFDARRAVDILADQPDVSRDRIGVFGHSLGAQGGALSGGVRPPNPCRGLERGWDRPHLFQLGCPLVPWRRDPPSRLRARPWPGTCPGRSPCLPSDRWRLGRRRRELALYRRRTPRLVPERCPEAIGLLNHHQGHALPASALASASEWLDWFLRAR